MQWCIRSIRSIWFLVHLVNLVLYMCFLCYKKLKRSTFHFRVVIWHRWVVKLCYKTLCKIVYRPTEILFFFRKKLCVKCNLTGIITLHSFGIVCYCVHITERNTMSNNKTTNNTTPKLTLVSPRYTVSLSESLYSVVYSESAFKGLTQHPCHFHTIQDAQQFINDQCKPNHPCYIIQVPVVAHT